MFKHVVTNKWNVTPGLSVPDVVSFSGNKPGLDGKCIAVFTKASAANLSIIFSIAILSFASILHNAQDPKKLADRVNFCTVVWTCSFAFGVLDAHRVREFTKIQKQLLSQENPMLRKSTGPDDDSRT